jgi:hypothetical protein
MKIFIKDNVEGVDARIERSDSLAKGGVRGCYLAAISRMPYKRVLSYKRTEGIGFPVLKTQIQAREAKGGCTAVHHSVLSLKIFDPAAPQRDSVQSDSSALTYLETAVAHVICNMS